MHNEAKAILYQNQARHHHNNTYSKQKVGLSIKSDAHVNSCAPSNSSTHRLAFRDPHFRSWPVNIFNLSLAMNDSLVLSRNESSHRYFCVRNFFSFVFIAFLYWTKMHYRLLERDFSLLSYAAWFLFIGFSWIGLLLSASHRKVYIRLPPNGIATIMADDPAPKRVRRAIHKVCEVCG